MNDTNEERLWRATSWAAAIAAAWAVRKAVETSWPRVVGREAPKNPADPDVGWRDVALWTVVSGLTAALARTMSRRGAAFAWNKVTGESPPEG